MEVRNILTNISLTFLGTGSAFSKKFGNNSAVLTIGDKNLLIDCGRTTPNDLESSKFCWGDFDAIFVTHLHGDHVYGLEEAGFVGRYVLRQKPHIIFPHKKIKSDLWEKVLKGTMIQGDLDRNMTFEDYFTYEIIDDKQQYFEFNGVMISVFSTQHVKNKKSYGLIIGEYDYVVYTSDSLFDLEMITAFHNGGAQKIFHDCQMVGYKGQVHASLDELSTLPEDIREKVVIMHYGDDLENHFLNIRDLKMKVAVPNHEYVFVVN
jgi:ribonuclease BN (tRNA processing enzyme)